MTRFLHTVAIHILQKFLQTYTSLIFLFCFKYSFTPLLRHTGIIITARYLGFKITMCANNSFAWCFNQVAERRVHVKQFFSPGLDDNKTIMCDLRIVHIPCAYSSHFFCIITLPYSPNQYIVCLLESLLLHNYCTLFTKSFTRQF